MTLFQMLSSGSFQWLVKAPTGFGKTVLGSMVMATRLGGSPLSPKECDRGYRVAYVTPKVNLCPQAKREFLKFLELKDDEIGVVTGKTSQRNRLVTVNDPNNKILVATPETLLTLMRQASAERGFDSLALLIVDEYQCAEGDHSMACLIREAHKAGVPIMPQSGTPVRDDEDLLLKMADLPLKGTLVPETLQPLKAHERVSTMITPEMERVIRQLITDCP